MLLCLSANNKCFKTLYPRVSALLTCFRQQTRAFTVINEGKWSKAVLEWDRQFFSAGNQQNLTLTKSEQSRRKRWMLACNRPWLMLWRCLCACVRVFSHLNSRECASYHYRISTSTTKRAHHHLCKQRAESQHTSAWHEWLMLINYFKTCRTLQWATFSDFVTKSTQTGKDNEDLSYETWAGLKSRKWKQEPSTHRELQKDL